MIDSPPITSVHGRIRSITGTDPAAGAEISETVPDRLRWLIRGVYFTFTTSATVANRLVHLIIDDGTNIIAKICVVVAHAADTAKDYSFANYGSTQINPVDCFYLPIPLLPLVAGYRIRTSTDLIEGDDDFSAPQLLIEEWTDPTS